MPENEEIIKLKRKVYELSALVEASKLLNSTLDLDELLEIISNLAKDVMRSEASSILLIDEATQELVFEVATGEKSEKLEKYRIPLDEGIAGHVVQTGKAELVADAQNDPRFYKKADVDSTFVSHSIMAVPLITKEKIIGVIELLNPIDRDFYDENDLELCTALAQLIAISVDNAQLHIEALEKRRFEEDLKVAREIQIGFLPEDPIAPEGYLFCGRNESCDAIGGDYYDFIQLEDGNWGLTIADVSGHGISASLLMMTARAVLHANIVHTHTVEEMMISMNKAIANNTTPDKYVTFFYGELNSLNGEFTYVNAGHNPPFFMHKEEFPHRIRVR